MVDPSPAAPAPSEAVPLADPPESTSAEPDRPAPELEIDDVQDSSESTGPGNLPGDGDVPPDGAVSEPSDAGVPPDTAPPVPVADAAATCPAGAAFGPSGRCYVAVQNTLSADAAQMSCNALGAGWALAAIHDAATNTFLGTLINVEAWVGASDAASEGEWIWQIDDTPFWSGDGETGAPVNGQFENWTGGEPNGETDSNCARLVPDPPRWADFECETLLASLCEGPPL